MKNTPKDALVVCGFPFSGKSEIAEQLRGLGWHREAFINKVQTAGNNSDIRRRLVHEAESKWRDVMDRAGYGGIAYVCGPSQDQINNMFVNEVFDYCVERLKERIAVVSRLGLRVVLDLPGNTADERRDILKVLKTDESDERFTVSALHMDIPAELSADRLEAAQKDGVESVLGYIPDHIRRDKFEPIGYEEGFERVITVAPGEDGMEKLGESGVDLGKDSFAWLTKIRPAARVLRQDY